MANAVAAAADAAAASFGAAWSHGTKAGAARFDGAKSSAGAIGADRNGTIAAAAGKAVGPKAAAASADAA